MSGPAAQFKLPFPPSVNSYWGHGMLFPKAWGRFVKAMVSEAFWNKAKRRFVLKGNWPKLQVFVTARGKVFRQEVLAIIKEMGLVRRTKARLHVRITAYLPDRRVHDMDNLNKATLDSLTFAGVWVDDEQVDHLEVIRGTVQPPGCLVVRIEKLPVPIQQDLFQ